MCMSTEGTKWPCVNQTNKINNHQQEHWGIHRKEQTLKVPVRIIYTQKEKEKLKLEKTKQKEENV